MLTPRHAPDDSLQGHLEFALKWEGVSPGVLKALFRVIDPAALVRMVRDRPTGRYARRAWFLYEWVTGARLGLPDAPKVRATLAVDPEVQFAGRGGPVSTRHRVRDNLPGTPRFCPLVRRTPELERYAAMGLDAEARRIVDRTHPDIVRRAAALLLLRDSRASFDIEGERASPHRAVRWGWATAEAGQGPLTVERLLNLQETLIGDGRFIHLGLRTGGGWVGGRERATGAPVPEHIGARHEDLSELLGGVAEYAKRAERASLDPVVAAAALSFGLVYIHPFEDGNGRIHRWLVHRALARGGFNPPDGPVLPVSAAMLERVAEYRDVLTGHSSRTLRLVEWRATERGNVEVLNETADLYRYFDATPHAEFLYRCIERTVTGDLPSEVDYLERYEEFTASVQEEVADMPEGTLDLLTRSLHGYRGVLPRRARLREFRLLTPAEVQRVEALYKKCFVGVGSVPSPDRPRPPRGAH